MRRLFYQTKMYDYSSIEEAKKHLQEMESKRWHAKPVDAGVGGSRYIYCNGGDSCPYTVEYFKEA